MPLTFPMHVSPEYGMRIESTVSSAVPLSATAHDVSPGAVALAVPLHAIVPAVVKLPCAVPATLRSPAQLALKFPLAEVADCSVTLHTKFVQEAGDGIRLLEVQVPSMALLPAAVGPVAPLWRSKPTQPETATADAMSRAVRVRFLMFYISVDERADFCRGFGPTEEEELYQR